MSIINSQQDIGNTPITPKKFFSDEELSKIVEDIRHNIIPSKRKFLSRRIVRHRYGIVYDELIEDSLDAYYVGYINDTLKMIRSGETAYLYRIKQVKDLLTFEPSAKITVCDGVFTILPL